VAEVAVPVEVEVEDAEVVVVVVAEEEVSMLEDDRWPRLTCLKLGN
jgi:hypothetical protein